MLLGKSYRGSFKVAGKQYDWTINGVLFSLLTDMADYSSVQQRKGSFGFLLWR